jgi:hypothetical protein
MLCLYCAALMCDLPHLIALLMPSHKQIVTSQLHIQPIDSSPSLTPGEMLGAILHTPTPTPTHSHPVPVKPANRPQAVAPRPVLVRCDGGAPAALRPQVTRRLGLAMGTACVSLRLLPPGAQSASLEEHPLLGLPHPAPDSLIWSVCVCVCVACRLQSYSLLYDACGRCCRGRCRAGVRLPTASCQCSPHSLPLATMNE